MSNRASFWFMIGFITVVVFSLAFCTPKIKEFKQAMNSKTMGSTARIEYELNY